MGKDFSIIRPLPLDLPFSCTFFILSPSTMTEFSFGSERKILPDLPLSLPVITITLSPFFTCMIFIYSEPVELYNLRGAGDYSLEAHFADLSRHWTEDTPSQGFFLSIIKYHHRIFIEPEICAVQPPEGSSLAHYYGVEHILLFHSLSWFSLLHGEPHQFSDRGSALLGRTEYLENPANLGA